MLVAHVIVLLGLVAPQASGGSRSDVLLREPFAWNQTALMKAPFSSVPQIKLTLHYGFSMPSSSKLSFSCFDSSSKRTGGMAFHLGWRAYPTAMYDFSDSWFTSPMIRVDSRLDCSGTFQADLPTEFRAFYALTADRAYLVGLEVPYGKLLPNSYEADNWIIGPTDEHRRWRPDLNAPDPVRQTAALLWLGGDHVSRKSLARYHRSPGPITSADSKAFEVALRDPNTLDRVRELTKSLNPWVQRQAKWTRTRLAKGR